MQKRVRVMRLVLVFSLLLLGVKFFAWWITRSNAILTDALESIVNVVAGLFALVSIRYASKPRDADHPYGHGKIEFVSAGFEGGLVLLAGGAIIFEAVKGFFFPHTIPRAEAGAWLSAFSGLCNFFMGSYLVRYGRKHNSALMEADGKHLLADTISSAGLVAGLFLIYFTGWSWIDNALAIVLGLYIFYTGFRIVRESLGNLLDEQDMGKINQLVEILNQQRRENWIDVHNLRVLKYGSGLHVDAHLTLPWYFSLEKAHGEVDAVRKLVEKELGMEIEFFIHADPCIPTSCPICSVANCPERKSPHAKTITWTTKNVMQDKKHDVNS